MPYTRADSQLVQRAATGLRMVIESLARAFATPDDDATIYDDVRQAIAAQMLDDDVLQMGVTQLALAALAPSVAIASAAYTTSQVSADQVNVPARGVMIVLSNTAGGTGSVTLNFQRKNADGSYTTLLSAAAPVTTAVGKAVLIVDPLVGAASAGIDGTLSAALPREWRVTTTANNANAQTYEVDVYPIR